MSHKSFLCDILSDYSQLSSLATFLLYLEAINLSQAQLVIN